MEITEVRIKLMDEPGERLQAFCSITFDDAFVVRDLKIIEGASGPFVAMPSRKLTAHCPQCGCKNHLRAAYCNQCGARLKDEPPVEGRGRPRQALRRHRPSDQLACREMIQQRVIDACRLEKERAKQPGYLSRYDDFFGDEEFDAEPAEVVEPAPPKIVEPAPLEVAAAAPPESVEPPTPPFGRPHVEPGTVEPRPPHTLPQEGARRASRRTQKGGFGRGIFDD